MEFISLFSGIGGFDLGFEQAGMRCVAQVEFDPRASQVLKHHWPNVKHFGDVRHVGKQNLPPADLICGGFPCQDVSMAGRRAGLAGERSGLWFEFHRILTECAPRWVVIENVPGLLTSNRGRDFATILHGLVTIGYRVGWRVLDAQYFGLAQRRKRVFIVGSLATAGANPAEILFERDSSPWDTPPRRRAGQGAAGTVIKGAAIHRRPENGPQYGEILQDQSCYTLNASEIHAVVTQDVYQYQSRGDYRPDKIASTQTVRSHNSGSDDLILLSGNDYQGRNIYDPTGLAPTLSAGGNTPYASGGTHINIVTAIDTTGHQGDRVIMSSGVWPTLSAESSNNGGGANALAFAPVTFPWYAGASRPMPLHTDIAPTLQVSNGMPMAGQPSAYTVRRLTPTECERLQGFPDDWTAVNDQPDSVRYKQLGNAVAVPVAKWLARRIVQAVAERETIKRIA